MTDQPHTVVSPDQTGLAQTLPTPSSPENAASPGELSVVQAALKLLPACQRCRRLRRKCDPSLPTCRQCLKSNSECCFYDHSLQQILPRSYVKSLIDRLRQLRQGRSRTHNGPVPLVCEDKASPVAPMKSPVAMRSAISVYKRSRSQPGVGDGRDDHYLIPTASGPKTRYFGRSSVFSLTVEVLARAQEDPQCSIPPLGTDTLMTWQPQEFNDGCNCTITKELVSMSIALYMSSLNTLYPFLDAAVVETDVEIYWQIYNASKDPSTRDETFQFFRITMITAIAFASRSRHNPSWIVYDNACYLQAAKCIETVTSEISVESLQALMLLIIYCLFRPRKGDIWKLLDYACRLSIELGYHTEQGPAEIEEEVTVQEKRRSTFWSLYTIERIVGQIFGRPSDLPETIFTTKYPDVAGAIELEGDEVAQRFSAAHHYRLVYLRSEIYKEIYLPSSPPVYPLEWYESRLSPILDWYRRTKTTKPEEQLEGVGTVTCSVAFHSTVIFVFQPIILHLLRKTRDGEQRQFHTPELFPEDGFYSACRLIQVYDKVVRSREDSILGTYPMTFMSAHYCWIAAMTTMAHCLLLLDGRLTPKRLVTDPRLLQETSSISLNNIFDISGSCLTLLMFCAEQWPGMISMVDVYRKLSSRILPQVIRKGIF